MACDRTCRIGWQAATDSGAFKVLQHPTTSSNVRLQPIRIWGYGRGYFGCAPTPRARYPQAVYPQGLRVEEQRGNLMLMDLALRAIKPGAKPAVQALRIGLDGTIRS